MSFFKLSVLAVSGAEALSLGRSPVTSMYSAADAAREQEVDETEAVDERRRARKMAIEGRTLPAGPGFVTVEGDDDDQDVASTTAPSDEFDARSNTDESVASEDLELDDMPEMSLFKNPWPTSKYFGLSVLRQGGKIAQTLRPYKMVQMFFFLFTMTYMFLKHSSPDLFHEGNMLYRPELWGVEMIFWFFLGIVTTIGLGIGFPSGPIFLFPHIFNTVTAGERCGGSLSEVSVMYMDPNSFQCPHSNIEAAPIAFMEVFLRLAPMVWMWGLGTAIGELPPYFLAKQARQSGDENSEAAQEMKEAEGTGMVASMKHYTIKLIENTGFWGIFLLASYPNAFFDMCGLCCGWLGIPFMTFFKALLFGKGLHKSSLEAGFFIAVFRQQSFESMCNLVRPIGFEGKFRHLRRWLTSLQRWEPLGLLEKFGGSDVVLQRSEITAMLESNVPKKHLEEATDRVIANWDLDNNQVLGLPEIEAAAGVDGKVSVDMLDPAPTIDVSLTGIMSMLWNVFIMGIVFFFLKGTIEGMAQMEVSTRWKQKKRTEARALKLEQKKHD